MTIILKVIIFPLLLVLPWAWIKLSGSEKIIQIVSDQPWLITVIFLPSIWLISRRLLKYIQALNPKF